MANARPAATGSSDIVAAGAVVLRSGRDVLLVHRPKYDDWSFPKGKRDRGEHVTAAAVREVEEETGLRVRLGRPLARQRYATSKGMKTVYYWVARVTGSDDVSGYRPNAEIDEVAWVPADKAAKLLTYPHDRETLAEALARPRKTRTVVVVRHAESRSRDRWHDDDRRRPLLATGRLHATALVPVLEAYGVRRVVSSPSTRCLETVSPFCEVTGTEPELVDLLSEEGARPRRVRALVATIVEELDRTGPAALCSHRPVFPAVFDALGLEDPELEKGEILVAHLRRGEVVAVERH